MGAGPSPTGPPPPRGRERTSQLAESLWLWYRWICIAILILSGLTVLSVPAGPILAVLEGVYEPRPVVEIHRTVMFLLQLAAVGAAIRALRRRASLGEFGRATALAGAVFIVAMAVSAIGIALWW